MYRLLLHFGSFHDCAHPAIRSARYLRDKCHFVKRELRVLGREGGRERGGEETRTNADPFPNVFIIGIILLRVTTDLRSKREETSAVIGSRSPGILKWHKRPFSGGQRYR